MKPDICEKTYYIQTFNELLENISRGKCDQFLPDDDFPENLKPIVRNINRISEMLKEIEKYSISLSRGDLDIVPPDRKNFWAAGIKAIHSQLNHITWQVEQISKGDYNQVVDFMGEFSRAFNTMTSMLKQREHVSQERQKFLMYIFNSLNIIIAVLDNENKSILFLNEASVKYGQKYISGDNRLEMENLVASIIVKNLPEIGNTAFFFENRTGKWYQIECIMIDWHEEKQALLCTLLDVTEIKQKENALRAAAEKDALTGVYRRDAGKAVFHDLMKSKARTNLQYVVCFLDIDNLKIINDKHGHKTGDAIICGVSEILKNSLRDTDIIIRMGGDEFVFILVDCTNKDADKILKRIFKMREKYNQYSGLPCEISFSIGRSNPATDHHELEALIEEADKRMYAKKKKSDLKGELR